MPRDGSNVYHYPTGIEGEPNQTIESPSYNSFLSDVEQDLNLPRPILAGGTGATSAAGALANLGGEQAGQIVTNYDTHVFVSGSFSSAPGATTAPNATQYFIGICYARDAGTLVIEARSIDAGTNPKYTRVRTGSVWGAWSDTDAIMDAKKVNRAGDTMTGSLTISTTSHSTLSLTSPAGAFGNQIVGYKGPNQRWLLRPGNDTAESGSNAGSDLDLHRYADNGTYLGQALSIDRSTGFMKGGASIAAVNSIYSGFNSPTIGTYYFGNNGTKYLNYDGSNFNLVGGSVVTQGLFNYAGTATLSGVTNAFALNIQNSTSGSNKWFRTGATGTLDIINSANTVVIATLTDTGIWSCNGDFRTGNAVFGPNNIELGSQTTPGSATIDFHTDGTTADYNARIIQSGGGNLQIQNAILEVQIGLWAVGYRCRAGISAGGYTGNNFNINHGSGQQLWIDNSNMGTIAYTSDYRTKKDVADLFRTWDLVKALRPIKYTHKDFTPPSEQEACAKHGEPFMKGDNIEQWGFIAHELQKTLTPSASSGVKDSPDTIQSPNPWTVIAALTKALQEAITRIEVLEAR